MVIPLHSGIQIDILRDTIAPHEPLTDLVYRGKDDCIWEAKREDFKFIPDDADGHRLPLPNSIDDGFNVTCTVNGTVLLDAIIVARG